MAKNVRGSKAWIGVLVILAVAALFGTGLAAQQGALSARLQGPGSNGLGPGQEVPFVVPAALATTAIDLNRSQSAGTYVNEYVTLNNSTTLTKLPAVLTVAASTCKWVVVANFSEAASPASVFHSVKFHNVTSANGTGNLADLGTGFKVCGGTGLWLNYVLWTYSIYQFSTTSLGTNGTATVTFGNYPGMTTGPAKVTAPFGTSYALSLKVSTNLTFTVVLPEETNSSTACSQLSQVCSFTQATFSAAADTVNTTTANTIAFTATSKLLVTGAYENWTVTYTVATVNANTAVGGFFGDANSVFQEVFVQYWYLWILVALGVIVVALVGQSHRRRR